jgi:hypothetical protein
MNPRFLSGPSAITPGILFGSHFSLGLGHSPFTILAESVGTKRPCVPSDMREKNVLQKVLRNQKEGFIKFASVNYIYPFNNLSD